MKNKEMINIKEQYINFIKEFSKINVSSICKEKNINRENILNGRSSEDTAKILYNEIIKKLEKLLEDEHE